MRTTARGLVHWLVLSAVGVALAVCTNALPHDPDPAGSARTGDTRTVQAATHASQASTIAAARDQALTELQRVWERAGSDDQNVRHQALGSLLEVEATARNVAPDGLDELGAKLRTSLSDLLSRDEPAVRTKAYDQLLILGSLQDKASIPLLVGHIQFVRPAPTQPGHVVLYGQPEPRDLPALDALGPLGREGFEALLQRAIAEDSVAVHHAFAELVFGWQGKQTDKAIAWVRQARDQTAMGSAQRARLDTITDLLLKRQANVRAALQEAIVGVESDNLKRRAETVSRIRDLRSTTDMEHDQPDVWAALEQAVLNTLPALLGSTEPAARRKAVDQIQVLALLRSEKAIPLLVANIEFRHSTDMRYFRGPGSYTEPTPYDLPVFMALRLFPHREAVQQLLFERALETDDRLIHECCVAFLADAMRHKVASPADWLEQRLAERPDLTDAQRERIADMLDMAERAARHEEMRPERFAHLYSTTEPATKPARPVDRRTELLGKLAAAKVACVRRQYDQAEQLAKEVLAHRRATPEMKRRAQLILDRVAESRSGAPASQPGAPSGSHPSSAPTGQ